MTDAFICDYIRTPIGRYGGALAPLRADDLAALPLAALLARNPALDPAAVEEVWLGCANQAGEDNRNVARMALLLASLPETVPGVTVKRHGLTPRARIVGGASVGVAPRVMGYGPVPAVRKLLERAGIGLDALALIELNEAFAAQALAVTRSLGLADDDSRVNPNGGAIALGHPLGMSGARIAGSAAFDLSQGTGRYALVTMCIGVGQGAALLLERV
ncbi:hypothetical protein JWJ88_19530 [Paracoccus methylovorus]|uniref:3-oxoadipyl-CoA thiolase n=1 Tax=Paracoccus methylovorus TaxID=2812658 RepID=A0ABX7JLL1_9RHOB|nr:hypothetical protein [Paracoccus methylovorus]QRZ15130.1 hypothetical protein JWJ88_19530 [Paracoccus methylovorus]